MIHAVAVVPILAPIMTEIACANVSSPALTKLTVNTVVAVEDCMAVVTTAPVKIPVSRLEVMVPNILRKPPPVSFCKASLIVFIPNINNAKHPKSLKNVKNVINFIGTKVIVKYVGINYVIQ